MREIRLICRAVVVAGVQRIALRTTTTRRVAWAILAVAAVAALAFSVLVGVLARHGTPAVGAITGAHMTGSALCATLAIVVSGLVSGGVAALQIRHGAVMRRLSLLPVSTPLLVALPALAGAVAAALVACLALYPQTVLIDALAQSSTTIGAIVTIVFCSAYGALVGICSAYFFPRFVKRLPLVASLGTVVVAIWNVYAAVHQAAVRARLGDVAANILAPVLAASEAVTLHVAAVCELVLSAGAMALLAAVIIARRQSEIRTVRPVSRRSVVKISDRAPIAAREAIRVMRNPTLMSAIVATNLALVVICVLIAMRPEMTRDVLFPQIATVITFPIITLCVCVRGFLGPLLPAELLLGMPVHAWVGTLVLQPLMMLTPSFLLAVLALVALQVSLSLIAFWLCLIAAAASIGLLFGFVVLLGEQAGAGIAGVSVVASMTFWLASNVLLGSQASVEGAARLVLVALLSVAGAYAVERWRWRSRATVSTVRSTPTTLEVLG